MRIPILHVTHPEQKFWLTDEQAVSPTRKPVLIDASGHTYRPADVRGVMVIDERTCTSAFYDAAQKVGYQVVWMGWIE
jgi:hypothetical protein